MDEETALMLVQEDYNPEEYEEIERWVDDGYFKHDCTCYYSIFLRKSDNTYWKVNFMSSYRDGLDEYSTYANQVEKKEVVKTMWMAV